MTAAHANHKSQLSLCFLWSAHKPCVTGLRQNPAVVGDHKQILSVPFVITEGLLKNHWAGLHSCRKASAWTMLKIKLTKNRRRIRGKEQNPPISPAHRAAQNYYFLCSTLDLSPERPHRQAGKDLQTSVPSQTLCVPPAPQTSMGWSSHSAPRSYSGFLLLLKQASPGCRQAEQSTHCSHSLRAQGAALPEAHTLPSFNYHRPRALLFWGTCRPLLGLFPLGLWSSEPSLLGV